MNKRFRWSGILAAGLLGASLVFGGCSGDDGARGPEGPEGPQGPRGPGAPAVSEAMGINSPYSATCYSCHQNVDDFGMIRAHMDNMGGDMYGFSYHGADQTEGCVACHGGLRTGGTRPTGLGPDFHAGAQHLAQRTIAAQNSNITGVTYDVDTGALTVNFTVNNAHDPLHAEFTVAKWVEDKGTWINLLQRSTSGTKVIRGGNLRFQDDLAIERDAITDTYSYTFASDGEGGGYGLAKGTPLDFSSSPLWRAAGDTDATTYCAAGDTTCVDFVQGIIEEIVVDGEWDPNGTYRIGISGRDRATYVRFTAVADVTLADNVAGAPSAPAPTNQIAQASCTSCHDARLVFPRNDVHGQQRADVNLCFNCHNAYTYDSDASVAADGGWVSISMNNMIHKIHGGFAGYTVDGYEYENVAFPDWTLPGTSNCVACHVEEQGYGTGWAAAPLGRDSCLTCHGSGGFEVNFGLHGTTLPPGVGPNTGCIACHDAPAFADSLHGVSARQEALRAQREDYHFELVSVTDAVYGETPVVRWQVVDADGVPYHLTSDITIFGGPRLHIGWGVGDDWTNEGSGEKSTHGIRNNDDGGRPVALNVDETNTVVSADGLTAITTFPAFTDAEAGKGHPFANLEVAEEGRRGFVAIHRSIVDNGQTRLLTSLVQPIILGSGEVELADLRRNTVSASAEVPGRGGNCLTCHGTIAWHGSGYTADNNIQACITCHNAGSHKSLAVTFPEAPYSVDMMELMHKVHSSPETLYPNSAAGRCHACHVGDEDQLDVNIDGPLNDGFTNCVICHDGAINQGRIGIISDWPGAFERYGLRGDGTNDGIN
ncbi:hypothetical protein [Desulfurivibrio sp. C05AmB]|uniref:multiheme c-type cytochrome n=1 Tax=Desulfurivibrio sp. C05AmB TaxID=3374371 RepID=UPI00376EB62F